jgi:cytochrome c5
MTLRWLRSSGPGRTSLRVILAPVLCGLVLAAAPARGQEVGQRGIDVFEAVCAACHIKGENGAPRIGDRAAWAKRTERGLAGLTRNALTGIRKMPPHGGDANLSRLELQRAIVYIVNQSGGSWAEPAGPGQPAAGRTGAQIVHERCALCHDSGFDGAPRIGDRAAWAQRTRLGIDRLVRTAIRGHRGMPPRGGDASLTDTELRSAVIYMASSASARAAADRNAKPARGGTGTE